MEEQPRLKGKFVSKTKLNRMAGIEKARREMVRKRKLSELSDQTLVVTPVKKFKGPLYGTRLVEKIIDALVDHISKNVVP